MSKQLNLDTHCKVLRGGVVSRECKPKYRVILRCVLTNMVKIYAGIGTGRRLSLRVRR
jgi:hypothetical protein